MPIYQYECEICGVKFERRIPLSNLDAEQSCPAGHHAVHRIYSVPTIVYKGSGFYVTDHPKSGQHKSG
jgi:putative FmdB family regulatory protein